MFRVSHTLDDVYVLPPEYSVPFSGALPRASFQRVHVLPRHANVYGLLSSDKFDFQEDKTVYLQHGATMPEIVRLDSIVRAVVKMVFDPELGMPENTAAIAHAIKGALKQEGLA